MVMLTIVSRLGSPDDLAEDCENAARYAEIKTRVLPYCQVLLSTGAEPQGVTVRQAPLGAVRSVADAQKLAAALMREYPALKFAVSIRVFNEADEAVYLPHDEPQRGSPTFRFDASQICA